MFYGYLCTPLLKNTRKFKSTLFEDRKKNDKKVEEKVGSIIYCLIFAPRLKNGQLLENKNKKIFENKSSKIWLE